MDNTPQCICYMPEAWSIEYVKSHWKKIEPQADISFFQSWAWVDSWLTIARPHIRPLLFKINAQVVGIAFVAKGKSQENALISFKAFFPFNTSVEDIDVCATEYNTPITIRGYESLVRKAMVSFLLRDTSKHNIKRLHFYRIPQEHYDDYHIEGLHYDIYKSEDNAVIDLKGLREKGISYDSLLSKGALTQIRRSSRIFQEKYGDIVYETADHTVQAQNWLLEMARLNQNRFNKKGKKGVLSYPKLMQMQRVLINRYFAKGFAEMTRLRAGKHVIGYLYNFIYNNHVYFYMCGFVYEKDNKLKPGLLTHYHAIKNHCDNGRDMYDFLAGNQTYKQRLGQKAPPMISFTITKPCFKYRFAKFLKKIKQTLFG